jgi:hypothetical protein
MLSDGSSPASSTMLCLIEQLVFPIVSLNQLHRNQQVLACSFRKIPNIEVYLRMGSRERGYHSKWVKVMVPMMADHKSDPPETPKPRTSVTGSSAVTGDNANASSNQTDNIMITRHLDPEVPKTGTMFRSQEPGSEDGNHVPTMGTTGTKRIPYV